MPDRLKAVLIGASGAGKQRHQERMYAPALLAHDQFEITGIVDDPAATADDRAASKALSAALGVDILDDFAAALAAADVASVCVPYDRRLDVISAAADHDVAMVVDKPLALTPADARRLASIVERRDVVAMPAHHARFHPSVRAAIGAVVRGDIGLPWGIQGECLATGDDAWPHGELANFLCYPLDIARAVLALEPRSVAAWRSRPFSDSADDGQEDVAVLSIMFDHEVPVSITVGRTAVPAHDAGAHGEHRYRIMGSEGILTVNLATPSLAVVGADGTRDRRPIGNGSVHAMFDHLASVRRGETAPELTFADAVVVAETVEAARRAADTRNTARLPH